MARGWVVLCGFALIPVAPAADGPRPAEVVDFKVVVESYALSREPVVREDLVARHGRVYQFSTATDEVIVIDPARRRVELLDLGRRVQAEVSFGQLDEALVRVRATLAETIRDREAKGGRANAVEAAMTRDLLDPGLRPTPGPAAGRVRLTNPTVEVDADGEPEADAARLALVDLAMGTIAKLGAFRVPNDLPPFVELDAIAALTAGRKLRPTELSFLYRLAGPPRRFRRTYRLAPALTDREREAVARVDRLHEVAAVVRYEKYRRK